MPHIVINGPFTPEDIWLAFAPMEFAEGDCRYKAEAVYLSSTREVALVRSLVVERGFKRAFLVRIVGHKPEGITMSLDPVTRPDISDAVKRILGLYAWQILQVEPNASVASTNIESFIKEPE